MSEIRDGLNDDMNRDLASEVTAVDPVRQHVAEPTVASTPDSFASDVSGFKFDGIREKSLELANQIGVQAKTNPWMIAGAFGFGALAAGYLLGRLVQPSQAPHEIQGINQIG